MNEITVYSSSISSHSFTPAEFQRFFLTHRVMYIAPSSGHEWLKLNLLFKLTLRSLWLFFDAWSANATLFERLMEIYSIRQYYTMMALNLGHVNVGTEITHQGLILSLLHLASQSL